MASNNHKRALMVLGGSLRNTNGIVADWTMDVNGGFPCQASSGGCASLLAKHSGTRRLSDSCLRGSSRSGPARQSRFLSLRCDRPVFSAG